MELRVAGFPNLKTILITSKNHLTINSKGFGDASLRGWTSTTGREARRVPVGGVNSRGQPGVTSEGQQLEKSGEPKEGQSRSRGLHRHAAGTTAAGTETASHLGRLRRRKNNAERCSQGNGGPDRQTWR